MKQTVIIGLLGSTLDAGHGKARWKRWRPTVSLGQHDDLPVHRIELLYQARFTKLAELVTDDLNHVSPNTTVNTHRIDFRDPWDLEEVYSALHDFARSYRFDTEKEDYLFHITTGSHVAQICMFLLTEARYFPGRLIQTSPPSRKRGEPRQGSEDDPTATRGSYRTFDLDLSKYDRIAQRFATQQVEGQSYLKAGIQTRNAAFNRMIEQLEHVAIHATDPILLTGPTGSGKTHLARRIYDLKQQRHGVSGKFIEINCATLRGDAAMSVLFGHKRGAFTGAVAERKGLLREADQGLLFLDEIGELGLDEQAMLLRAIEDKRFLPVGSDREVASDFQLICGTNRDLYAAVAAGRFREDLLARINLWSFSLPGLAQRQEDIEPNIQYELERVATTLGSRVSFTREAAKAFLSFATSTDARWTGNFRDLGAAMTRMATLAPGGRIGTGTVREEIARLEQGWRPMRGDSETLLHEVIGEAADQLDRFDRVQLADVIAVCRESRTLSDAGRKLFGVSRSQRKTPNDADRLRKYLAKFQLAWADVQV